MDSTVSLGLFEPTARGGGTDQALSPITTFLEYAGKLRAVWI